MTSPHFSIHGDFSWYVEGRLVITDVTGPWNKELVELWSKSLYPLALELSHTGPHVGIAQLHRSMLCPPDAMTALRRSVVHSVKLGCLCQVIVVGPGVEGRNFVEPVFTQVYQGLSPYRIFEQLAEAKAWSNALLHEKGY
jgi:hypothetical protein